MSVTPPRPRRAHQDEYLLLRSRGGVMAETGQRRRTRWKARRPASRGSLDRRLAPPDGPQKPQALAQSHPVIIRQSNGPGRRVCL